MIDLFRPFVAPDILEFLKPVLSYDLSGRMFIGQGNKVELFEKAFQFLCGLDRRAYSINSGTAGLELAAQLLDFKEGDEVITTPITCFGYKTKIQTDKGKIVIGKIVHEKMNVSVKSYNEETKQFEYKPVTNYIKLSSKGVQWYRLTFESALMSNVTRKQTAVLVTGDHKILTTRGYVAVEDLTGDDRVLTEYPRANTYQQEIIDGTLLGDGFIQAGGKHNLQGRLGIAHVETQKEWLDLKVSALKGFEYNYQYRSAYKQSKGCYRYQTKTSPYWKEQRQRWYQNGRKIIPRDLVLTPIMIATWYMDDGSKFNNKGALFCTDSYDIEETTYLTEQLQRFGIQGYIGNKNRIYIQDATNLWKLISPYMPETMRYKMSVEYDSFDPSLWNAGVSEQFVDVPIAYKTIPAEWEKPSNVYCLEVEDNHNFIAGKMIVSNCTATQTGIFLYGATPVWADVDPYTGLIDPVDVERKISPNTKAIIAVNWGGKMPDYGVLKSFGIPVIEDAAHGPYATTRERGDYIMWSLQAIKFLTTIDGGMLYVPEGQEKRAKLLRWYGLDRESKQDFRCEQDIKEVGRKLHMNDVTATIGLANIRYTQQLVRAHNDNALYYTTMVQNPSVRLPVYEDDHPYWIYTVIVKDALHFKAYMEQNNIMVSPVHARNDKHSAMKEAASKSFMNYKNVLTGTDFFDMHQMSIPVGFWLTMEDKKYIVDTLNRYKQG